MKLYFFVWLSYPIPLHLQAQDNIIATVEYRVSYYRNGKKLVDDTCLLDIGTCQSLFYSLKKRNLDKNIRALFEKTRHTNNAVDLSIFHLTANRNFLPVTVFKKLCDNSVVFIEEFNGELFGYNKENSIYNNWEILEDTLTIQHISCHKARIRKDSIHVTAWFCASIPFREGPLSYFGLPGLILKVQNSKGWEIEFSGIFYNPAGEKKAMDIPYYSIITEPELIRAKQQFYEAFKKAQPGLRRRF